MVESFEREMKMRRYDHDAYVFERANLILDETSLNKGLDEVSGNHSYLESFLNSMVALSQFYSRTQNQYLDVELQRLGDV